MRFLTDGIDFPDELLWAQDDQRVVFFCGAGVSRAKANLSGFNELTNKVLDHLGAESDNDARRLHAATQTVENDYEIRGLSSADRIFGQMRRDFTDQQIGNAVAQSLKPTSNVDLSAHKTMLKLAQLPTGEVRLITTNFDRLFKNAGKGLKISTRSGLPNIEFSSADWGIVHLHGVVTPDYSGPSDDGFVLSSAEFGDAYLSHGWAKDFIKKVLEKYVAVFVGYSADDPPVRYLLEGLQQNSGKNRAYAFQSVPDNQAIAAWDEKGVTVIPFDIEGSKGYDILWESLSEWAKRSANPRRWRNQLVSKARKGPCKLKPHERGMVSHLVKSRDGARVFSEAKPAVTAEWLSVFDSFVRFGEPGSIGKKYSQDPIIDPHSYYKIDSDLPPRSGDNQYYGKGRIPEETWSAFDIQLADLQNVRESNLSSVRGYAAQKVAILPPRLSYLSSWIIKTADQPQSAWWAAQQIALHPDIIERVGWEIERAEAKKFSRPVKQAWRAIFEYNTLQKLDRDKGYSFDFPPEESGFQEITVDEYIRLFESYLTPETSFRSPVPPTSKRGLKMRDIVGYNIGYPNGVFNVTVPDAYLSPLVSRLSKALYKAWDLETRYSYWWDIVSIERDEPKKDGGDSSFNRGYKLSGHVLHYVSLFEKLANLDSKKALSELKTWPANNPLFDRLRIWAMGNLRIVDASDYAQELLTINVKAFWPFRGNRDLMLGLKKRWLGFSEGEKRKIERRILKGPPKLRSDSKEKHEIYSAYAKLNRLFWLKENGCDLGSNNEVKTEKLKKIVPDWNENMARNAARTHDGGGGWVRVDTKIDDIASLKAKEIIPHILTVETRPTGKLVEYDPFLGLSLKNPDLALRALKYTSATGPFPKSFWSKFLRTEPRSNDEVKLTLQIARALTKIKIAEFVEIAHAASQWFESKAQSILMDDPDLFHKVWNKFLSALKRNSSSGRSSLVRKQDEETSPDWVTEAINSPAGNLAQYLDNNRGKEEFTLNEGLPEEWKNLAESLFLLPGDSRRYAITVISFNVNYLYYVDSEWTKQNILSILNSSDLGDKQAFWAGFFSAAVTPHIGLYILLKGDLVSMARSNSLSNRRNVENLSGILLAGWNSEVEEPEKRLISNQELRAIILESSEEFRRQILWNLERFSEHKNWHDQIPIFLSEVWPKQKTIRTRETSSRLVELALSQKENFREIVNIVCGLVSKVDNQRLFIPELRKEGETIAGKYPDETLDLLYRILPENPSHWPFGADSALRTIGQIKPSLKSHTKFIELESRIS